MTIIICLIERGSGGLTVTVYDTNVCEHVTVKPELCIVYIIIIYHNYNVIIIMVIISLYSMQGLIYNLIAIYRQGCQYALLCT